MTARWVRALALAAGLILTPLSAAAQHAEMGADDSTRPWAEGVSKEDQQKAVGLFQTGNQLLRDALFVKAAEIYRQALTHWEHPAIYYNLALALINLDKPLELREALDKAMRFGAAPLDEDKFRRAQNYKRLTDAQLAHITVVCDVPGTEVRMDGATLFTAPGRWEGLIPVGEHSIVATKQGYLTTTLAKVLKGGDEATVEVRMYTVEELTRREYRWPTWQPWAVVGGGVAVAAVGGLLHVGAKNKFDDFDAGIVACGGCTPTGDLASTRDSAELLQGLAVSAYVLGAAVVASGAVMAYANRAKTYRISPEELEAERRGRITVVPALGPESAGIQATLSF